MGIGPADCQVVGVPENQAGFKKSLTRVIEIAIGTVMILSGWLHLQNHMHFYIQVAQYRLLSGVWLRVTALSIPWLLLIAGFSMFCQVGIRPGSVVALLLFITFCAAQAWVLMSGLDIDCGCFGTMVSTKSGFSSAAFSGTLAFGSAAVFRLNRIH